MHKASRTQGCWNRLRLGMSEEKARGTEQRSSKTFMPQGRVPGKGKKSMTPLPPEPVGI